MNKKAKYELILIILIGVVLINTAIVISHPEKKSDSENCYNMTTVGSNENGTVYKIIAGNNSSNDTVGVILGVHPREHEIHEEVNKTIANITGENGTNNLTKKFVIYYVVTNDNLYMIDGVEVPASEVGQVVAEQAQERPDGWLIMTEPEATHGAVVKLMDEARNNGVTNISITEA